MSRWYIIHAYSGFENKVRDAIMSEANRMGLTPFVEQIEVAAHRHVADRQQGGQLADAHGTAPADFGDDDLVSLPGEHAGRRGVDRTLDHDR